MSRSVGPRLKNEQMVLLIGSTTDEVYSSDNCEVQQLNEDGCPRLTGLSQSEIQCREKLKILFYIQSSFLSCELQI